MTQHTTDVVCIIFGLLFCAAMTCSSNETDVLALLAFKAAIADPLGALNSWNQTQHDHCTWNGIICGVKHPRRVVEISLGSQGLLGTLSSHIGNLSFLRAITLQNNSFHGHIPQEIGRLRRLEYVEFSNNSFLGEIPTNISQCVNLVYVNLLDNSLSGSIPVELSFLPNLQQLGLGKNNLSGSIPPCLGNLTTLVQLSLWSGGLWGEIPRSLSQLWSLKFLNLGENRLMGRVPSGLFNISSILVFSVSLNQLQGTIPDNIGLTLPSLRALDLGHNRFTGELPASLSNATSLEQVLLGFNSFKGPMPKELGRLSNLKHFILTDNLIRDDMSFIASFTNCTKLMILGVSSNLLSGSLPASISNLSRQIYDLEISLTQIHGNIPSGIGNLVGLTRLLLFYNYLEGPIPFRIGELSYLQQLDLGGNRLAEEIPQSFGNLTLLNYLNLGENSLSESLPTSLGNCTSLLDLDISSNFLSGTIPPQILSISSLSGYLFLSNNSFMGSIPNEVGSLTHLDSLDLSNNKLWGFIPNSLSTCTSLERLHLGGNLLEGEIPSALSDLKGLQDLDLSRNNLSGRIPVFLGDLSLKELNLSFNRLNGEVPMTGVFGNTTGFSIEGNAELCGGIPELKLPHCSSSKFSEKHQPSLTNILIPTLVGGGLWIILCICVFIYIYRRKKMQTPLGSFDGVDGEHFMRLSYGDLLKATNEFSDGNLVGAGRFGTVYKGILEDGNKMVAVKILNLHVKGASKSFIAECIALKRIRHRNLLRLLSVCESIDFQRNEFKALVYEFMSNGSLEDFLYHNKEQEEEEDAEFQGLKMLQRLEIVIDVAHALEYLHVGTDSPVIHGDLKPSNVLLDDNMVAHVGDFGLSKVVQNMLEATESSSTIGIKGTLGYIPPEYGTSNSLSTKGDVYSYGIFLMAMFTGKKPTDETFVDNLSLHNLVASMLPDHVAEIMDPHILEEHVMNNKMENCVASILSIGLTCSRKEPMHRICMTDVVHRLCKIRDDYIAEEGLIS